MDYDADCNINNSCSLSGTNTNDDYINDCEINNSCGKPGSTSGVEYDTDCGDCDSSDEVIENVGSSTKTNTKIFKTGSIDTVDCNSTNSCGSSRKNKPPKKSTSPAESKSDKCEDTKTNTKNESSEISVEIELT